MPNRIYEYYGFIKCLRQKMQAGSWDIPFLGGREPLKRGDERYIKIFVSYFKNLAVFFFVGSTCFYFLDPCQIHELCVPCSLFLCHNTMWLTGWSSWPTTDTTIVLANFLCPLVIIISGQIKWSRERPNNSITSDCKNKALYFWVTLKIS